MKQGIRRIMASMALILAVSSCTDLPQAPRRGTSGEPDPGATSDPAAGAPVQPAAPPVARLTVEPTSVELNAPYSLGGYQSETQMGPSDAEAAGFPTSAQILVAFLADSGERTDAAPLIWHTSNPGLVMVDGNGWIRAVDPGVSGTATITVHLRSNPEVFATTEVTVHNDGKLVVELM